MVHARPKLDALVPRGNMRCFVLGQPGAPPHVDEKFAEGPRQACPSNCPDDLQSRPWRVCSVEESCSQTSLLEGEIYLLTSLSVLYEWQSPSCENHDEQKPEPKHDAKDWGCIDSDSTL